MRAPGPSPGCDLRSYYCSTAKYWRGPEGNLGEGSAGEKYSGRSTGRPPYYYTPWLGITDGELQAEGRVDRWTLLGGQLGFQAEGVSGAAWPCECGSLVDPPVGQLRAFTACDSVTTLITYMTDEDLGTLRGKCGSNGGVLGVGYCAGRKDFPR